MYDDAKVIIFGGSTIVLFVVGIITLSMWGCPQYKVYSQRQSGLAQLAEAESSRQIAIAEAKAKEESAKHLANAEVERANGIAKANSIIGGSLKQNHEYLTWLWIEGLQTGKGNQIIYVPTEANIPIIEAGRRLGVPVEAEVKP